jgi:4-hydroxybenzoate polyprenyltransferase
MNDSVSVFVEEVFRCFAPVLPLYLAGIAWTLVYDTIYAHQDKRDDMIVGVKSTALRFGSRTKIYLTLFSVLMLAGLYITTLLSTISQQSVSSHPITSLLLLLPVALHLFWQIKTVNLDDPRDCAHKFRSNNLLGALIFCALLLHRTIQ